MKRSGILAICTLGCGMFLSWAAPPAFARDDDKNAAERLCNPPVYEAISTLYTPSFGVPAVWDAVYENGRDGHIRLADFLPMDDGTVLVVGDAYDADKTMPTDFVFARINKRGRTVMEKRYALRSQEVTAAMTASGTGYIVSSHFRQGGRTKLRLSWYDKDGSFMREKIIADPEDDYKAKGIVPSVDGKGFLVYVKAVADEASGNEYSRIFSFSGDGALLWERSYRPGIPNAIGTIFPVNRTGHYVAAGSIRLENGRMGGWLLELDREGAIVWQRTYPRGASAAFDKGEALPDGHFVMAGTSAPAGGGMDAAWIMEISWTGEPVWQRFVRHDDLALSTAGIDRRDDGRMILMLNADVESDMIGAQEGRDHIRLLTLSPRGNIMEDEPYIDAVHAEGQKLMTGREGERIMLANIVELVKPEGDGMAPEGEEAQEKELLERKLGWIVVAVPLEPYTDICEDIDGQ